MAFADRESANRILKNGIWLYFFLLLFEGALRKWILPGLATPLLIVRDPVAIYLLIKAWQHDKLPVNNYTVSIMVITIIAMLTALMFGHGNLFVAMYGARILLFHFPFMFLIGHIFTREDVIDLGRITLWISLPMVVLIALQFYSPQSALVNRGIGNDALGGGFSGALGFFRPPGTFSFTSGNTQFFCFVGVFVIYFWLNTEEVKMPLLIAATFALLASIPLSISRGLTFQLILSLLFAALSISRKPKYLGRMLVAGMGIMVVALLLSKLSFFQTATAALTDRFDSAGEAEGGVKGTLGDRFLGGLLKAVTSSDQPFWGYGIGMGTNAGAKLLTGEVSFLISEEEWGRLVGEMGAILGITVIALRLTVCLKLLLAGYKALLRNDLLPWIIMSFGFVTVAQSQWAQPASLGFSTIIGGLAMASLRRKGEPGVDSFNKN